MQNYQQNETIREEKISETSASSEQFPEATNSAVPSTTSSPSHEFSFTLSSVHSAVQTAATSPTLSSAKAKQQLQAPSAIDLSPADEIFFHGHLLPLHFLSHLHASSPRSSTTSLDNFTLPIKEQPREEKPTNTNNILTDQNQNTSANNDNNENFSTKAETHNSNANKSKPFSLFGLAKWRKGSETTTTKEKTQEKKKVKFDVSEFVKRYLKMVKPLLSARGLTGRRDDYRVRKQSYSFSGSLTPRLHRREVRGSRGEFSAPASMITSPTNSGRILPNTSGVPSSPVSDSTMEELQAAIQAAIAHCKNSISSEEKKAQEILPVPVN